MFILNDILFYQICNLNFSGLRKWKIELAKAKEAKRQPSLLRALIQMFGPKLMLYGLLLSIVEIVLR